MSAFFIHLQYPNVVYVKTSSLEVKTPFAGISIVIAAGEIWNNKPERDIKFADCSTKPLHSLRTCLRDWNNSG